MDFLHPADYIKTHGTGAASWSPANSQAYTRWLSGAHYENFHVASIALPKRLHQDFFNVYSYCRWADDLGDEIADPQESLDLLAWWRGELHAMYEGRTTHPVFIALADTVERHQLGIEPFEHLIRAFEQDQRKTRYETYEEVLDYCVYSANPVGRLVLQLCGYADEERVRLSDLTCTGLQLANHWQDVRRDYMDSDRIYIPENLMDRHGYSFSMLERDIKAGACAPECRAVMRDLVNRAESLFLQGLPLVDSLDRRLSIDIELFSRGGLTVLDKIRKRNFDVISERPRVRHRDRVRLLVGVVARQLIERPPLLTADRSSGVS